MTHLRSSLSLTLGTEVVAKLRAHNERGWSSDSPLSSGGPTIETEPQQMSAPTQGSATSDSQIQVDWVALSSSPSNGGSTILSYHVQWDQGTSTWVDLVGAGSDYTGTSFTVASGVSVGNTYQFKVRAKNKWGWGTFSTVTAIVAQGAPDQVTGVTTSIDAATGGVKIVWSEPNGNGDALIAYVVEIRDSGSGWRTETTDCNGADPSILSNKNCIIPMNTLTGAPFSLTLDTLVEVRIAAVNSIGTGSYSTINTSGALIRTVPAAMAAPTAGSSTTDTQIQIDWVALAGSSTGNSPITSYEVYWDNGSGTTSIQLVDSLVLTYTQIGLSSGTDYKFKVRAKNIYGNGPFSTETTIKAAAVPATIATVTTSIVGSDIKIAWVAPTSGGDPITKYSILIYKPSTSTYVTELTNCDGSDPFIISNLYCTVPMTYLVSNFGYAINDLVRVQTRAENSIGAGGYSSPNTAGATIETAPTTMGDPVQGAGTDASQIVVTWTALTADADTGASSITSYNLDWDIGGGWVEVSGFSSDDLSTSKTITSGFTPGQSVKFRLRAKNTHGWGPYSNTLTISPSSVPATMAAPTTSIDNTYVKITWVLPADNGSPITQVKVVIKESGGTYTEEPISCDGSDSGIFGDSECFVPMTTLRAAPYSLITIGTLVEVKVQAMNGNGWSTLSSANTVGATIETEPTTMNAPQRGGLTSQTQIEVTWSALSIANDKGGSAITITSYHLQMFDGGSWTTLVGLSPQSTATSFTVSSGIVAGTSYQFRLRA